MKKFIVICALSIGTFFSFGQSYYNNGEGSFIEIRTTMPVENKVISYSAKITLNEDKSYNSYYDDKVKYRSFEEQIKFIKQQLDSVGIATKNITEETPSKSSYSSYGKSKQFSIINLNEKQLAFVESLNRGSIYVQEKKIKLKAVDTEESVILKSINLAKQKAEFIAKTINKKVGEIKYVINSTNDFKEEEERGYYSSSDKYQDKYYMVIGFYIEGK